MSEDFKPGDLAVCVDDRKNPNVPLDNGRLKVGNFYRVIGVARMGVGKHVMGEGEHFALFLQGMQSSSKSGGWSSRRFKKVYPTPSEIADRIRACRPVKTEQPA